jgi:hypothetical protein
MERKHLLWFSLPYTCPTKREPGKPPTHYVLFVFFLVPSDFQTQPQNEHSVHRERRDTLAMILKTCYYYCSCCTLHQLMIHKHYNILIIVVLVVFFIIETKTRVCHTVALPFTLKSILRQKEELWKLKYSISQCKNIIFKKSSKRNQNPWRYYNSRTNLKFQHKPKYHLSRTLI